MSTYSTIMVFNDSAHASPLTDHLLNSSFVTAAPILTRAFPSVFPVTSCSSIVLNSFARLLRLSGRIELGSGTLVAVLRSSMDTNTSLSSENSDVQLCLCPAARTRLSLSRAHWIRLCRPYTVVGTKVKAGVLLTVNPQFSNARPMWA